jgi:hypothetical protein
MSLIMMPGDDGILHLNALKADVEQGGTAGKKMMAIAHAMAITLRKPPR